MNLKKEEGIHSIKLPRGALAFTHQPSGVLTPSSGQRSISLNSIFDNSYELERAFKTQTEIVEQEVTL